MNATVSRPREVRISFSYYGRRDWPLAVAAIMAVLSFAMLFPSWISGDTDLNAFSENMPTAGPALIVVMALAVLVLIGLHLSTGAAKYSAFSLLPASNLLVIYIIKLSDVSDLIDQTEGGDFSYDISIGVGLWLGFFFSLATLVFLVLAVILQRGILAIKVTRQHEQSG